MQLASFRRMFLSSLCAVFAFSVCLMSTQTQALAGPGTGKGGCDHRVPYTPKNDVQFIDALGPHHEMAIEMINEELERGAHHDVKELAKQMKEAQLKDIEEMRHARKELTGEPDFKPMHDPHGERDLAELRSLSGHELDKKFLLHMIPHHAAALSLVHRALPYLKRHDLKEIAKENYHDQAKEIGQMLEMLEDLRD